MLPPSLMLTNKKRGVRGLNLFLMVSGILFLLGCKPPGPRALWEGKKLIEQGKFSAAIEELRVATSLLGTNALAWNYLGLAYHGAGQTTNARLAYQKTLALNHDLVEAHYNLGCLLLEQHQADADKAARSELTAYTLRRPNSPGGWLKLGTAQLRTRELGTAEKSFNSALHLGGQNAEALNGLGVVHAQKNRPQEAAQYFSAALKQTPDYRPALLNLAVVSQESLNARPVALQKYREYLALKPRAQNWEAVNATARLLEQQLAPARPAAPINLAAPISANTNPAPKPAENLPRTAQTNVPRTAPTTNQTPAPNPPKTNAPVLVANAAPPPKPVETPVEVVRVQDGPIVKPAQDVVAAPPPVTRPAPALIPTTKAATTATSDPRIEKRGFLERINPANLFRRDSKSAPNVTPLNATPGAPSTKPVETAAIPKPETSPPSVVPAPGPAPPPAFNRYVYHSPAKPAAGDRSEAETAFAQGVQAQRDHRPAAAVAAYGVAIKADPGFFEAQYNLGLAAFEAKDLPQSLVAYENALAITPDSANARYNFALALKEAGYPVDAAQELEKVLAAYPDEARAHLSLANLYAQQLNQQQRARQHYLRVLAINPQHPQATAIRYWLAANP
ncbi:MAG: tetratricopeptide repeat protein [Verrucomicrobia bacterium]|nr:tetratricopeptide repeat protein [Verrucomicrobiota bacterium]